MSTLPSSIQPHWLRWEQDRQQLIERLQALPADALHRAPQPNAWCVLEVVEHLSKVDYVIFKEISNGQPKRAPNLKDHWLRFWLVTAMDIPLKFKAPRATRPTQKEALPSLKELVERWHSTREAWHSYLLNAPTEAYNKVVFTHPRAGGLTLPQTLRWLYAHQRRHLRQIQRLIATA